MEATEKQVYETPEVVEHGSLEELTMGGPNGP